MVTKVGPLVIFGQSLVFKVKDVKEHSLGVLIFQKIPYIGISYISRTLCIFH